MKKDDELKKGMFKKHDQINDNKDELIDEPKD